MPTIYFPFHDQLHAAVLAALENEHPKKIDGKNVRNHDPLCASLLTGSGEVGWLEWFGGDEASYCVMTVGPMSSAVHKFGSMIKKNLPLDMSGCVAVQPGFRTLSLSFGKGFGVSIPTGSVKLLGMMVSGQACTKVAMDKILVLKHKRMTVENGQTMTSHAGMKMSVTLTALIPGLAEASVTTTAEAYMNLDFDNDGSWVSPFAVVQALLQNSCLHASKQTDWAVLMKSKLQMSLVLGEILDIVVPGKLLGQVYAFQTSAGASLSISFHLEVVDVMSDIFPHWKTIKRLGLSDYACKVMGIPEIANAFCEAFIGFGSKRAVLYFTASSQSLSPTAASDVGLLAQIGQDTTLSIRKNDEGWEMCYGETCVNQLCVFDNDCGPKDGFQQQCAQLRGDFRCEPVYGACCTGVLTCEPVSKPWTYQQCKDRSLAWVDWLSSANAIKCANHPDSHNPSWHCIKKPAPSKNDEWGACCANSIMKWEKESCKTESWTESECKPTGWYEGNKIFWLSASAKYCKEHPEGNKEEKTLHCIHKTKKTGICNNELKEMTFQASVVDSDPGSSTTSAPNQCPGGEDTGGRCRLTACVVSRGAVECKGGWCLCKPGFCLTNGGKCEKPLVNETEIASKRTMVSMAHGVNAMICFSTVLILQQVACNWGHFSC